MTELYEVINHRRVKCGRCRHEVNQVRVDNGIFDSAAVATYNCTDCHAVYGICRRCGQYVQDGEHCASCADNPAVILPEGRKNTMLPDGMYQNDEFERDPAGRAGHWLHVKSDTVVSMDASWRPKNLRGPVDVETGVASTIEDLSGKPVVILQGRFSGKFAVITENGLGDDAEGLRVHIPETGDEVPFESFGYYLRFATPDEVAGKAAAVSKNSASPTVKSEASTDATDKLAKYEDQQAADKKLIDEAALIKEMRDAAKAKADADAAKAKADADAAKAKADA